MSNQKFIFVFGVQHDSNVLPEESPWHKCTDTIGFYWSKNVVGIKIGSKPVIIKNACLLPVASAQEWFRWSIMRERIPELKKMTPAIWMIPVSN